MEYLEDLTIEHQEDQQHLEHLEGLYMKDQQYLERLEHLILLFDLYRLEDLHLEHQ